MSYHVLVVCSGNTCRSPMAKALVPDGVTMPTIRLLRSFDLECAKPQAVMENIIVNPFLKVVNCNVPVYLP